MSKQGSEVSGLPTLVDFWHYTFLTIKMSELMLLRLKGNILKSLIESIIIKILKISSPMLTKIERHNVCDLCCPRSPRASTWSRQWSPCVGPGRRCIDSVIPSSLGIRQSLSYWSQNSQHNPNIFSFSFELLKSVTLVLTNTRAIYLSKH